MSDDVEPIEIKIEAAELQTFADYTKAKLSGNDLETNRLFDDLLRLSGSRYGLVRAEIAIDRTVDPPTAVISIRPTRELVEKIERAIFNKHRTS